jgi:serine/threonine protein phosphatase PrpC
MTAANSDPPKATSFRAAALQLQGGRRHQNDRYRFDRVCGFVADGAGPFAPAGDAAMEVVGEYCAIASSVHEGRRGAVEALLAAPDEAGRRLAAGFHDAISTVAGYVLAPDGILWLTAVGDSRAFLAREGRMFACTDSHNALADLRRMAGGSSGSYPHDDRRLAAELVRAVGAGRCDDPDVRPLFVRPGDTAVVVSDGFEAALGLRRILAATKASPAGPEGVVGCVEEDLTSLGEAGTLALDDNSTLLVAVAQ